MGVDLRVLITNRRRQAAGAAGHRDVRWIDSSRPPTHEDERSAQIVAGNLNATTPPATLPVTGTRRIDQPGHRRRSGVIAIRHA
jgi:hypothetical protein